MLKVLLLCLICSLPALGQAVDASSTREVRPDNGATRPRVLASSAFVASDGAAPGIECRLPAVRRANPAATRDIIQASDTTPRSTDGMEDEVAAYVRLHRHARTDIPFEWRPLGDCVLP